MRKLVAANNYYSNLKVHTPFLLSTSSRECLLTLSRKVLTPPSLNRFTAWLVSFVSNKIVTFAAFCSWIIFVLYRPFFKFSKPVRLAEQVFVTGYGSNPPGGGVLPHMGYIGMCGPKGYGFSAVLVINRVSIIAILPPFWS